MLKHDDTSDRSGSVLDVGEQDSIFRAAIHASKNLAPKFRQSLAEELLKVTEQVVELEEKERVTLRARRLHDYRCRVHAYVAFRPTSGISAKEVAGLVGTISEEETLAVLKGLDSVASADGRWFLTGGGAPSWESARAAALETLPEVSKPEVSKPEISKPETAAVHRRGPYSSTGLLTIRDATLRALLEGPCSGQDVFERVTVLRPGTKSQSFFVLLNAFERQGLVLRNGSREDGTYESGPGRTSKSVRWIDLADEFIAKHPEGVTSDDVAHAIGQKSVGALQSLRFLVSHRRTVVAHDRKFFPAKADAHVGPGLKKAMPRGERMLEEMLHGELQTTQKAAPVFQPPPPKSGPSMVSARKMRKLGDGEIITSPEHLLSKLEEGQGKVA